MSRKPTRKDFESAAAGLRAVRGVTDPQKWREAVNALADTFAKENPAFDTERFIRACEKPTHAITPSM